MLLSVFGYFLYITAMFSVAMAVLIGVSNHSPIDVSRRYPSPVAEPARIAVISKRLFATERKFEAKASARKIKDAGADPLAGQSTQPRGPERLAHVPNLQPQQREPASARNYD